MVFVASSSAVARLAYRLGLRNADLGGRLVCGHVTGGLSRVEATSRLVRGLSTVGLVRDLVAIGFIRGVITSELVTSGGLARGEATGVLTPNVSRDTSQRMDPPSPRHICIQLRQSCRMSKR